VAVALHSCSPLRDDSARTRFTPRCRRFSNLRTARVGQVEDELRPPSRRLLMTEFATVGLDELSGQGEAESRATLFGALEESEHLHILWHTRTVVGDGDTHPVGVDSLELHCDPGAAGPLYRLER